MLKTMIITCLLLSPAMSLAHDHSQHAHHGTSSAEATNHSGSSLFHSRSKWKTTDGKDLRFESLNGKVSLVSMVYTGCQTACPMIVTEMKSISNSLPESKKDNLQIVLFSFDSDKDTPANLEAFTKKMSLDSRWKVLSPNTSADTAEIAALLGIKYRKLPDGHFVHSNVFFLMNEKGEIIAKKEGLNADKTELKEALKKAVEKS